MIIMAISMTGVDGILLMPLRWLKMLLEIISDRIMMLKMKITMGRMYQVLLEQLEIME